MVHLAWVGRVEVLLEDFKIFSNKIGFEIHNQAAIKPGDKSHEGKIVNFLPNLFATYGIYEIGN